MGPNSLESQVVMNPSSANDPRSAKPSEQLLESLSALMDDEADALEVRRLVKSLPETPQLTDHWRRYHAIRASLLQETHVRPSIDLLPGIRARLNAQNESVGKPPLSRAFGSSFFRFVGQGAVAASVAAAVLLGYPLLQTGGSNDSGALVAEQGPASQLPVLNGDYTESPLTRTVSLDAAARDRLQQAVYEFSGTSAVLDAATPMFPNQLVPFEPEAQAENTVAE
jgi:negative regulator of sigma E activity